MAGGIDWFRWHHGSVTDPKFALIARKANARLGDVIAVWAYLLEQASASPSRGSYGALDLEAIDCLLDAEDGTAEAILTAMCERGLVNPETDTVVAWEKRQPKREREDDSSTDRVRAFRDKQRHETPRNANDGQETPREEEKRGDMNTNHLTVVPDSRSAPPPESTKKSVPFLGDANLEDINPRAIVPLAAGWELPAAWGLDAEALGFKPDEILREAERFRQYYVVGKQAGKRSSLKGWRQAWSNWLSKAENFRRAS